MKFLAIILLLLPLGHLDSRELVGLVRDVNQTLGVRRAFGEVIGNSCLIAETEVDTAPFCALTSTLPTQENLASRKQTLDRACNGINALAEGTMDSTGGQVRAMATEQGVKASFRKKVGDSMRSYLSSGNTEQRKAEIWRMLGHEGVPSHGGDGLIFDMTIRDLQSNDWAQKDSVKQMLNSLADLWGPLEQDTTDNGRQRCNTIATPPSGWLVSLGVSNPPAQIDSPLCAQVAQAYSIYEVDRQEQIYTPARMQQLEDMLDGMKDEMDGIVDRMPCASLREKLEMKRRIRETIILPATSDQNLRSETSAFCGSNEGSHYIHFPPAYLAMLSGGNAKLVEQTMAHELAHAMDGQTENKLEKYKRPCPALGENLSVCLQSKYNLNNYPNESVSLYTESFADNIANELINARVRSTDSTKRFTAQEVARRACMFNAISPARADGSMAYTGDTHPVGTDRATQLLAGPNIRRALGCTRGAPFSTAKTCGVGR